MTRHAIYFTPAAGSPWWEAGCRWLGRDAEGGTTVPQPAIAGVPPPLLQQLTADARRYGFHATLKAPFRLRPGFDEHHLAAMADAFAAVQRPVVLQDVRVRPIAGFLALVPSGPLDGIGTLAMRCVDYFDLLRAPPTDAELLRRRGAGLNERQEALLRRWGYPYTEELFRFHMTLTDRLTGVDAETGLALRQAADKCFASAIASGPLTLDGLAIFREDAPGEPFTLWRRFSFNAQPSPSESPAPGRLFFFVGASGVGKDALLGWLEQHAPDRDRLVFARRTITRPVHPSEAHEAVDDDAFERLSAAGAFALQWQANGLRYGIEADLKAGRDVVVNGSREYLPQLRQLYPDACVVWVEADADIIRQRIEARRRESGAALLLRLERMERFSPVDEAEVVRVDNSGPLEVAGERVLRMWGR